MGTKLKTQPKQLNSAEIAAFHYSFSLLPDYFAVLHRRLRIAVVYGGDNREPNAVIQPTHHPRPWKSYRTVAEDIANALKEIGFQHVETLPDDMNLPQRLRELNIHLVWLNTGGTQGYNPVSHTPAMLEMLGMPYIGHNPLNSSILDNKHVFKLSLQGGGIRTAQFVTWHPALGNFVWFVNSAQFKQAFRDYKGPFVVKPVSGRASLNVHVAQTVDQLAPLVSDVYLATRNTVLIERYLAGKEYCVSVCGALLHQNGQFMKRTQPFAFAALERVLSKDESIFTSMDKKPITTGPYSARE